MEMSEIMRKSKGDRDCNVSCLGHQDEFKSCFPVDNRRLSVDRLSVSARAGFSAKQPAGHESGSEPLRLVRISSSIRATTPSTQRRARYLIYVWTFMGRVSEAA
jgi:hypothetical protein